MGSLFELNIHSVHADTAGTVATVNGSKNDGTNSSAAGTVNNLYGSNSAVVNSSSATTGTMFGSYAVATNRDTANVTSQMGGVRAQATHQGSVNLTNVFGVKSDVRLGGTGDITYANGMAIDLNNYGTGAVTNWRGLYIEDEGTNPNHHSIYIAGTTPSYFGGNLGIGVVAPNTAIDTEGAISVRAVTTAPAVSPTNQARVYFDNAAKKLKISEHGDVYSEFSLVKPAISNAGTSINFSLGRIQTTTLSCGSFNLSNLKDGGSYVFVVQGATSATCTFTASLDGGTTLTVHLPSGHGATTASTHTVYKFFVAGTDIYFSWQTDM